MATYSSGSTVGWRYILETSFGVLPATAMTALRAKPSKMTLKKDTYTTDEVRSDRAISDLRHGMRKAEGSIEGDLMMTNWDDFILAALQGSAWTANVAKMGTTLSTFCIEQQFLDIGQYRMFKGMAISKMKVSAKPGSMVDVSFDFIGQDATASGSAAANTTTAASSTAGPFSYAKGVIQEGGGGIAYLTGIEFEVDNGLGTVGVIGSDLTPAIFNGRSSIKGNVTALFKDQVMLNKFLNETESSISAQFYAPESATGTELSHTILLPRVKYTGGDIAPPKEGAVIITLPFEALYHAASSSNIVWTRDVTP